MVAVGRGGLLEVPLPDEYVADIEIDLGPAGLKTQSLVVSGHRSRVITRRLQGSTEIDEDAGLLGRKLQSGVIRCDRLSPAPCAMMFHRDSKCLLRLV